MNATDSISVSLQVQQWNVVLGALAEAPWRIADPVIRDIARQTGASSPSETITAKPNGAAESLAA